ncbi:MAG: RNA polymerase factor sigma-54 [Phycisphaerales bacterium]|nr:RNA polymerase factor sigma-54 [Planctomycetota bacterium]MBL6997992.1 RNA polymerase factor sigma-54 [Phycisphaerales bacterium]
MKFKMGQQLKTGQQLTLAPRIIQTMEIMQLPLPALEEKIEQELESNIALELVEPEPVELDTQDIGDDSEGEFGRLEEFEEQSGADFSDLPPRKAQALDRDPKLDAMSNIRARKESLSEVLLHQWSFADVDDRTEVAGRVLIGLIDVDGFLTLPEEDMQQAIHSELQLDYSSEEIEAVILLLQKWLDPPGIAARSLQESLLNQVNEFMADDSEGWGDVAIVIESHLDDLISNRLPKVATSSGIGLDRVKRAIDKMHELTLSPGRLLASDRVLPVIPDAFIQFDDLQDHYVVGIRSGNIPPLKISTQYEAMSSDPGTDDRAKHFIQRNINAARWLIEAVEQRKKTLSNIVEIVADRQSDFLDQGDAYLRPLPMVEVADMLGIHVATVSRAVSDKWVQTPRGIFPLRRFFSGGTGSDSEGEMSWEAVKSRLQEIVDNEDKMKPLSDDALAKKLREQGIEIARRTVVKYRQQLGLPAARLRKKFWL